jgi:preprotein translocase subunit SecE
MPGTPTSSRNPLVDIVVSTRNSPKPARNSRGGGIFRLPREVIAELKKSTWPSREEATRLTIMVVIVSIVMGVLLGIADLGFSKIFEMLFA